MNEAEKKEAYAVAEADRGKHTKAVLECTSRKIVVVAGPGTGKTHLFQKLLEQKGKKSLVLSFVNALVDDLALGLSGMSEVRTLHGFVASYLWTERKARMYPDLPRVIREDAKVLLNEDINFEETFRTPAGKDHEIEFYKGRKEYYGKYFGYADAAYAVVKDLEAKKRVGKLPKYEQVLVDEFQDFNDIEVSLIDLLAESSPVLIAGDDGQSLYAKLKGADPKHLRDRHGTDRPEYVSFELPYCSRCPEVVIEAVNDVSEQARKSGLLADNIDKPYKYFKCEEKDKVGRANPQILYFQRAPNGIIRLLTDQLTAISERERKEFSVLIIVPPKLKKLIAKLVKPLQKAGFRKLSFPKTKKVADEIPLLSALELLLEDKDSNLGWRMAAKHILSPEKFAALIMKSSESGANVIPDLLDVNARSKIKEMRATLNLISNGKTVESERLAAFLNAVSYEPLVVTTEALKNDLDKGAASKQSSQRNIRDLPITITTIPGSKGLAADYVFLVYFDPKCFGGPNPADEDVFNFVVAMTRAKKGLNIVSTTKEIPLFVEWIADSRIRMDLMPDYEGRKK